MALELYFAPYACSMVVRIVADEAGVALRYRQVEQFAKTFTESGDDYLGVNPRGQVPVLMMDDGETLAEVSAIVQLIAEIGPVRGLVGSSEPERYRVLEGLSFAATEVHKRLLYVVGDRSSPAEARAHARTAAPTVFAELARTLGTRPYYAGERFTLADAYFAWALIVAKTFRLDRSPVAAYAARLTAHPSVARALELETPLARAAWSRQGSAVGQPPWLR